MIWSTFQENSVYIVCHKLDRVANFKKSLTKQTIHMKLFWIFKVSCFGELIAYNAKTNFDPRRDSCII